MKNKFTIVYNFFFRVSVQLKELNKDKKDTIWCICWMSKKKQLDFICNNELSNDLASGEIYTVSRLWLNSPCKNNQQSKVQAKGSTCKGQTQSRQGHLQYQWLDGFKCDGYVNDGKLPKQMDKDKCLRTFWSFKLYFYL